MKKYKLPIKDFCVSAHTEQTTEHPNVFKEVHIQFRVVGDDVDKGLVEKAVQLSMTKYCGVSAMLSKAVPIIYEIYLNNEPFAQGKADFSGK